MKKVRKGYTLIEILIVMVCLGALATLVVPRYTGQTERGIVAEATAMLATLRQAEAAYNLENSAYATTVANLDVDASTSTKFAFTVDSAGTSTATRTSAASVDASYRSKTIILDIAGTWSGDHPYKPNN